MYLPMEILSPVTTRTDSGAGVSTSRSNPSQANARFDNIFENELSKHDQKMSNSKKSPGSNTEISKSVKKGDRTYPQNKSSQIDDKGQSQAAGVMGTQNDEVVFVLEGEESVATPQLRADIAGRSAGFIPEDMVMTTEANASADVLNEVNITEDDLSKMAGHAVKSDEAVPKDDTAAKPGAADEGKAGAAGEVTARTPDVVSESNQSSANTQSDSGFYGDGSPGLLENESDTQKAGRDESYLKSVKEAINKADDDKDAKVADTSAASDVPPPMSLGIKPEQIKATAQMIQAAEAAVRPENLFEEMISRVETMQNAAKSTMTIQLNPEFLGKVALEVAIDAAGVHVKINAEDSSVRGMINSQLATLIESLENKGIAVSEVEVVFAGANFDNFSGAGGENRSPGGQGQTGSEKHTGKAGVEYYTTLTDLMDYYLDAGISSVEYSA